MGASGARTQYSLISDSSSNAIGSDERIHSGDLEDRRGEEEERERGGKGGREGRRRESKIHVPYCSRQAPMGTCSSSSKNRGGPLHGEPP